VALLKNIARLAMFFIIATLTMQIIGGPAAGSRTGFVDVNNYEIPNYHVPWDFYTYASPDFTSEQKNFFFSQRINIVHMRQDGWALVCTYNGNWWMYARSNRRYIDRRFALYEDDRATVVARIDPQVVDILGQNGNWYRISTWIGSKWIHLPPTNPSTGKRIALTFDDGPVLPYTEHLLNALYDRNVPVTFYVVGEEVAANPDLARRMVNEGHEIGIHTYTHANLTRLNARGIRGELTRTCDIIQHVTGVTATTMRPPFAAHNSTVHSVARELGLPIIMWNVDTRDWESRNVNTILSHFVNGTETRIREGNIILMHDTMDTTIDAAIRAIDILIERGFTFVTASDLLIERHGELIPGRIYR
jgi:peptidoglycan/xylan/chitin deacetylase (PgdA/CDA1 family)